MTLTQKQVKEALALAEKAVSDRDTYRTGLDVANAEVARLTAERYDALRERDAERLTKTHRFALRRELEEALCVGDSYADGALEAALVRVVVLKTVEADRDRLRRELAEALAGREREYARAEAEHDAAARIASEWSDVAERFQAVEPCPDCWGPKYLPDATCVSCAHAYEADDEARQMPGGAT